MPRAPVPRRPLPAAAAAAVLLVAILAAGCATRPPPLPEVRALAPPPAVPDDATSPADAVLAAFLAANGLDLPAADRADLVPPGVVQGRIDRAALLRAARSHDRIVAVLPAPPDTLWELLGKNIPLLLYLPGDAPPRASAPILAMPVAWNRTTGGIAILDGAGPPRELPADRFFALRDPVGQTALCLARPHTLRRLPIPDGDRTLLLAGHCLARGRVRRASTLYASLIAEAPPDPPESLPALAGLAETHVLRGRPGRAIPFYERALALAPDDPRLLNNLAYAMLLARADPATALPLAEKAVDLAPTNPNALETAAALHLRLGDAETAARLLERAWTHSLRHPPETQVAIQDQLARAWLLAGRPDLARQVASHRYAAHPDFAMPPDLSDAFPDLRRPRAPLPAPTAP